MALSKGLRLLARLEAAGDSSVLLEARGRGDCLLFEAGTVATLERLGYVTGKVYLSHVHFTDHFTNYSYVA